MAKQTKFKVGQECYIKTKIIAISLLPPHSIKCDMGKEYPYVFIPDGHYINTSKTKYGSLILASEVENKSEYPKWMMVSLDEKKWYKRFVIYKHNNIFFAMSCAENNNQLDKCTETFGWKFTKDIEPKPSKKEKLLIQIDELKQKVQKLEDQANKM